MLLNLVTSPVIICVPYLITVVYRIYYRY